MNSRKYAIGFLVAILTVGLQSVQAADGTWSSDANGNWSGTGNWTGGIVADGIDSTATLTNITANRTLTLDSNRTNGNIVASATNANFTISGNTLTLAVTAGSPTIDVPTNRTLTISSAVAGTDGFTKTGEGTATLSGANTINGDVTVSGGLVNFDRAVTFTSLSGTGDFYRMEDNGTLTILDASTFQGSLATYAGGNSGHTIQFQSIGDAVGCGSLITRGGTGDSNQRTKIRLYGDVGPVTMDNRAIEILSRQATPKNWSGKGTRLENNNATPANKWVINKDLVNETDRNHELYFMGSNTGSNEFAGAIGNSTGIGGLGAFYSTETGILKVFKEGNGKWIFSGTNTYTGGTTISAGTLVASATNSLSVGNVTVSGSAQLVINEANAMTNTAKLYLPSASTSNLTMNANLEIAELYIAGSRQPNGTYTSSEAWMGGAGSLKVGGDVLYWDPDGDAGLGTGSSTPSGTWDAGSSYWNNAAGQGAAQIWSSGLTAAFSAGSDATDDYTVTVDSQKDISGLIFKDGKVVTVTGSDLRMTADSVISVASAITANVDVVISEDASARGLTKIGDGTLVLSKANTYSGPTEVGGGTLEIGTDITLSSNLVFSAVDSTVSGSGTLNFGAGAVIDSELVFPSNADAGGAVHTISCGISGSPDVPIAKSQWKPNDAKDKRVRFAPSGNSTQTLGRIELNHPGGSQGAIVVLAGSSTNSTVEAVYSLASYQPMLIVEGTGKWKIEGDITTSGYPIDMQVKGGTLIVNGNDPHPGTLYVENARLGGDFTYGPAGGDGTSIVDVRSGGILAPGDGGTGTMTFDWGNTSSAMKLHMQDSSIYEYDVSATTNDRIHMSGHSGGVTETLDLDNFTLRILDASDGEAVEPGDRPVFTYDADVTVDMAGFSDTVANYDLVTAGIESWGSGGLSLSNDVSARVIYLIGLAKPPSGTMIMVK